jgi:hypothetical protein
MPDPKFAPIPTWCALSGMSRTATYDALAAGCLIAIKIGRRTLVDVEPGLAWLRSRPKATFGSLKADRSFSGSQAHFTNTAG